MGSRGFLPCRCDGARSVGALCPFFHSLRMKEGSSPDGGLYTEEEKGELDLKISLLTSVSIDCYKIK